MQFTAAWGAAMTTNQRAGCPRCPSEVVPDAQLEGRGGAPAKVIGRGRIAADCHTPGNGEGRPIAVGHAGRMRVQRRAPRQRVHIAQRPQVGIAGALRRRGHSIWTGALGCGG